MKIMNKPLAAAFIAAAVLSMTACAQTATTTPAPDTNVTTPATGNMVTADTNTILVTSKEGVKVVPDIAQISFAVLTQEADPKTAQEKNSADVNNVMTFLKNSGIDEKSIQTSNYGLSPIYDWSTSTQRITSYQVNTNISVSGLSMDQVSPLLSSSVDAGINWIESVSYLSSKYDETYQEALKKAVDSAKVKAEAIAAASGVTLDGIAHIEELAVYQNIRYTAGTEAVADAVKSVVVEPGQVNVEAQVNVTFRVK